MLLTREAPVTADGAHAPAGPSEAAASRRERSRFVMSAFATPRVLRSCGPLLAVALAALLPSYAASAGHEVVLKLRDGDFEVAGELRSFDGARWVVAAQGFGELALEAARFECIAGPCGQPAGAIVADAERPSLDVDWGAASASLPLITIAAAAPLDRELMPALVRAYARHLGGTARQLIGADTGVTRFRIRDGRARDIAEIRVGRRAPEAVFTDLTSGQAVIGATTRQFSASELATVADKVQRLDITGTEQVLGLDGLAVIVNPQSPARRVGAADLARLLAGQATDWAQVGLAAAPVKVFATSERVFDSLNAILPAKSIKLASTAVIVSDEAELSDAVAREPGAIGLVSATQVRSARAIDIGLSCGLTARPDEFTIKAEEYPLGRRLLLYANGKPKEPMAQEFLRFAASRDGQEAVREGGLIDQRVSSADAVTDAERIARATGAGAGPETIKLGRRLAEEIKGARRLPLTFRFAINSSELDAKARGDLQRLADLIRAGAFKDKAILLVGYTDAAGKPQFNAGLAERRAAEIRQNLLKSLADVDASWRRIVARGVGPVAPVACNDGGSSQFRNRRVEVWLSDQAPISDAGAATRKIATNGEATVAPKSKRKRQPR